MASTLLHSRVFALQSLRGTVSATAARYLGAHLYISLDIIYTQRISLLG